MSLQRALVAILVVWAVGSASAVTPIGEFTGDMWEGFENILPPQGYPMPIPIFEGTASFDDTLAHYNVITFVWSGPGGQVEAYDGNFFAGGVAGSELFSFSTPIYQFGGWFTTVGALPGGTIIFRDAEGGVIDTLSMDITPVVWGWQGWSSSIAISTIEIIGASVPGISTQMDDLQITLTPPATTGACCYYSVPPPPPGNPYPGYYAVACRDVTAEDCTGTYQGTFHGPGTACATVVCAIPVCRGDTDCDGNVGFSDIDYFVAAIPDNEAGWAALYQAQHGGALPTCPFANCDVDGSGAAGFSDIDPFVNLIPSGCPNRP